MNRSFKVLLSIIFALVLVIGLSLFLQTSTTVAKTDPGQGEVIRAGLEYLRTQQQVDGGILGFSGGSDPDTTARSVLAFVTAGTPVSEVVSTTGNTMLDYLSTQAISFTHDTTGTLFPGRAGLLLSAVSLAGEEPADFGGMDLAGELEASFLPDTGAYSTTAVQGYSSGQASDLNQAWAILGLSLAGKSIPESASQFLFQSQAEDGSWGFGDPDTTALAVIALLSSRQVNTQDQAIQNALQYFHTTQVPGGGWKPSWDTDPLNADSTGWILQALVSAGEDPTGQSWMVEQTSPVQALMSLQKPDGSIGGTYANPYSTAEVIIGLSGNPLTNLGVSLASHRAGLAVFWGDNTVYTACVSFPADSITGLDLLKGSGLPVETATNPTQGTAVCAIGVVGNLSSDCFGSMPNYWSYWQLGESGWEYSVVGADQSQVVDGGAYAWSWASGDAPAVLTFQNICEGVPYELPAATQTSIPPTDTPVPTQSVPTMAAAITSQPTAAVTGTQPTPGTYAVYGAILIVLAALIIYLVRSRNKKEM